MARTPTEDFVYAVCRESFLSLWSYANPQGRTPGRELCDILVVCDPDVVIISVKQVHPKSTGNPQVDFRRWTRRAIDESVAQIYGAERWIGSGKHPNVVRFDGQSGLPFPHPSRWQVHRVAVALGGEERFPLEFGDFGKGFVHVLNRRSFEVVLQELDTVADFVTYLTRKEELFFSSKQIVCMGEENLLAVYLHNNRSFPLEADLVVIEDGAWSEFTNKPEVRARDEEDVKSYVWDRLIEFIGRDVLEGNLEFPVQLSQSETALRYMARETRFARRVLGQKLVEFLELARLDKIESRMALSLGGTGFVFLASPPSEPREDRNRELGLRCFVARGKLGVPVVIGLATEQPGNAPGVSWSLCYLLKPSWTEDDEQQSAGIRKELGFFAAPIEKLEHYDEYPPSSPVAVV